MYDYFNKIELSADWEWQKLEKVGKAIDGSYGEDTLSKDSIPITVLGVGNVTKTGQINLNGSEIRYLSQSEIGAILNEDDLFIVKSSGSASSIQSGKTAICPKELDGKVACSNFLIKLVPKKELVTPYFLWVILNSQYSKEFVKKIAGSTTYPNIKWNTIKNFHFPNPKKPELRRIIAHQLKEKLTTVEQMGQAASKQKEAVEALRQTQLDEIFNFKDHTMYKFKKLKTFENIEISAGKAVSSVGGSYSSVGIPFLQVNNFDNEAGFVSKKLVFINEPFHNKLKKSEVLKNDVLINIVGPPIGKICWYPDNQNANINQAIVRVRCPREIDYKFLTYYLRTTNIFNYFLEVKVGVRQWNISSTNIGDISIPVIPIERQLELVNKWESKKIIDLKIKIKTQLEAIEALPAAILREVFEFKS